MAPKGNAANSPPRAKRGRPSKIVEDARAPTAAKRAKIVEDPFLASLDPIFSLLRESENTTAAAQTMFESAVPFALRSSKSERHAFQAKLVEEVANLLQRVETSKKDALQEEESNLTKLDAEIVANVATVNEMTSKQAECTQHNQAAVASLKEAWESISAAKLAHAAAVKITASLEEEHVRTVTEKKERETFMEETWVQLKAYAPAGDLRGGTRRKLIEDVSELLAQRQTEVSCIDALQVTLKEKPDKRGHIGTKCIEHAEKKLVESVQELGAKIEAHAGNVAEKTREAEEAASKVKAAEDAKAEKEDIAIEAENSLLEASEACKACTKASKELEARAQKLASIIALIKEGHVEAKSVVASFEDLLEHGEKAPDLEADPAVASVEPLLEPVQAAVEMEA